MFTFLSSCRFKFLPAIYPICETDRPFNIACLLLLDSQSFVHLFPFKSLLSLHPHYIFLVTLEFSVERLIVLAIWGPPCCLLSCRVSDEKTSVFFNFVSSHISFNLVVSRISLHSWLLAQWVGMCEGYLFLFEILWAFCYIRFAKENSYITLLKCLFVHWVAITSSYFRTSDLS